VHKSIDAKAARCTRDGRLPTKYRHYLAACLSYNPWMLSMHPSTAWCKRVVIVEGLQLRYMQRSLNTMLARLHGIIRRMWSNTSLIMKWQMFTRPVHGSRIIPFGTYVSRLQSSQRRGCCNRELSNCVFVVLHFTPCVCIFLPGIFERCPAGMLQRERKQMTIDSFPIIQPLGIRVNFVRLYVYLILKHY